MGLWSAGAASWNHPSPAFSCFSEPARKDGFRAHQEKLRVSARNMYSLKKIIFGLVRKHQEMQIQSREADSQTEEQVVVSPWRSKPRSCPIQNFQTLFLQSQALVVQQDQVRTPLLGKWQVLCFFLLPPFQVTFTAMEPLRIMGPFGKIEAYGRRGVELQGVCGMCHIPAGAVPRYNLPGV